MKIEKLPCTHTIHFLGCLVRWYGAYLNSTWGLRLHPEKRGRAIGVDSVGGKAVGARNYHIQPLYTRDREAV